LTVNAENSSEEGFVGAAALALLKYWIRDTATTS
jgi:hypothetical protein